MAVVLKYDSSISAGDRVSDGVIDRKYLIGAASDVDAYSELIAHADCPDSITVPFGAGEVFRKSVLVTHVGNGNYEAECSWAGPESVESEHGDAPDLFVGIQFSTAGRTEHITQSLNTRRYPPPPWLGAPDCLGQIGVSSRGVDGVDVVIPGFNWDETHVKENADVGWSYLNILKNLTGTVNNATFRGHAAGEVLFTGCQGTRQDSHRFELTYSFVAIPNATGLIAGDITGIEKKGHEYMWIAWNAEEDDTGKFLIQKPAGVYVEQVYKESDFSALNIGVGST